MATSRKPRAAKPAPKPPVRAKPGHKCQAKLAAALAARPLLPRDVGRIAILKQPGGAVVGWMTSSM
jgi:hypothetical protein